VPPEGPYEGRTAEANAVLEACPTDDACTRTVARVSLKSRGRDRARSGSDPCGLGLGQDIVKPSSLPHRRGNVRYEPLECSVLIGAKSIDGDLLSAEASSATVPFE